MSILRLARTAALLCGVIVAPALAADLSPVGQWEVASGESRYRISYCGAGGKLLCARLTWLRDDVKTKENLALLGDYVVKGAREAADNEWTCTVHYDGHTYEGTVTLLSRDAMLFHSCSGIFCQSFELNRL